MQINIDLFELARRNPRPLIITTSALIAVAIIIIVLSFIVNGDDNASSNYVSSHVLDISEGTPALGVNCTTWRWDKLAEKWLIVANTETDENGRISHNHPGFALQKGVYKLQFDVGEYFKRLKRPSFFPQIDVIFEIDDDTKHYHVPITLSNYGYSTYKGQ